MIGEMCRYVKDMFKRDSLRSPADKGVINYLKRKMHRERTIPDRFISIFVNRYCNLNCFSCGALGMNPTPDETSLGEIEAFLERMKHYKPESTIMLTGGEPTMVKEGKLRAICEKIRAIGYKPAILTNGFKMTLELSKLFDYIVLDDHGVNSPRIAELTRVLEPTGKLLSIVSKGYHQDMRYAMEDNITKGARCGNWVKPLTLWKHIVYPCCNIMCVEWWRDTTIVTEALFEAGWHIDNPNLLETVLCWRVSLPAEVYRLCSIGCWKDSSRARWEKIEVN